MINSAKRPNKTHDVADKPTNNRHVSIRTQNPLALFKFQHARSTWCHLISVFVSFSVITNLYITIVYKTTTHLAFSGSLSRFSPPPHYRLNYQYSLFFISQTTSFTDSDSSRIISTLHATNGRSEDVSHLRRRRFRHLQRR